MTPRVLVVDDEQIIRELLYDILKEENYQVFLAEDGAQALAIMEKQELEIVISDLKMPNINGTELLKRIKEQWPKTEVIISTGYASVDSALEAMKYGAFDYLLKPLTVDQVCLSARRALAHRQLLIDQEKLKKEREELIQELERRVEERTVELRHTKESLQRIIDNASAFIILLKTDGRILLVNRKGAQILGKNPLDLLGTLVSDLVVSDNQNKLKQFMQALSRGEVLENCMLTIKDSKNQEHFFSWSFTPLLEESSLCEEAVAIGLDVTEQKLLETQLFHAEKLASLGRMAAGIAHEMRNPLTSIAGHLELLLRCGPDEKERRYIETSMRETARIQALVQNLLQFAKPPRIQQQEIILRRIMEDSLAVLLYQMKHIDLQRDYSPEDVVINGGYDQIKQVFINVLANAIQACHKSKTKKIIISIQAKDKIAQVVIADSGCGIPNDQLSYIFEPFYTTKGEKGTGLGLSITKQIVQSHKGDIRIISTEGKGSRVIIELPLLRTEPRKGLNNQ